VVRACWRVEVVDGFAGDANGDWRVKDPSRLAGVREFAVLVKSDTVEQERKE
jgi:hypothetical protein